MPSDKLYTPQQKAKCVLWYASSGSPKEVQVSFRRECGRNAQAPGGEEIVRWYTKFLETGSVLRKKKQGNKWVLTPDAEERIMQAFRDPATKRIMTARKAAAQENFPSRMSIQRVLNAHKFHPYKIMHQQKLTGPLHFLINS
jgi:hypothetical protein